MAILYFTPYFPPTNQAAAARAHSMVQTLEKAGHEVEVLSNQTLWMKLASNQTSAVRRLCSEVLLGVELFFRILLRRGSFLTVLSSPPFFSTLIAAFAVRLRKGRYVLDIRDLYPEVFFEMKLVREDSVGGRFVKRLTQRYYQGAHHILTVTEGLRQEIFRYGIPLDRIELVRNGYDAELFRPGIENEKFDKFTVIFQGNLGKVQNISTLLQVAKSLEEDSEIEILLAGDGPRLAEVLEASPKNIRYLGNLPHSDIPPLLRRCHLGLSFRTDDKIGKEAFPVKVFEYIGSGIPVIVTPRGEAGAILEEEGLGWQFENCQIEEMREKILSLKKNPVPIRGGVSFTRQEQAKKILSLI